MKNKGKRFLASITSFTAKQVDDGIQIEKDVAYVGRQVGTLFFIYVCR